MNLRRFRWKAVWLLFVGTCSLLGTGCQFLTTHDAGFDGTELGLAEVDFPGITDSPSMDLSSDGEPLSEEAARALAERVPPSELTMVSLPRYVLEPPDVLLIDAVRLAPKHPYTIQTQDFLQVFATGLLPEEPVMQIFQVQTDGTVNLGPSYGPFRVEGMTVEEAKAHIEKRLDDFVAPEVSITLAQMSGQQQIAGEHLIGPDGTVNLGVYGGVYVAGMTLVKARAAIEKHLSQSFDKPKVSVDIFSYNSKMFYVIIAGAGTGDQVIRLPVTGKETVLDAVAQVGGLSQLSSKRIWISRPSPTNMGYVQVMPVDWNAITRGGSPGTNYQILPGDRVYISEDPLMLMGNMISKVTQPFERVFGSTLLSAQTVQLLQRFPKGNFSSRPQ